MGISEHATCANPTTKDAERISMLTDECHSAVGVIEAKLDALLGSVPECASDNCKEPENGWSGGHRRSMGRLLTRLGDINQRLDGLI